MFEVTHQLSSSCNSTSNGGNLESLIDCQLQFVGCTLSVLPVKRQRHEITSKLRVCYCVVHYSFDLCRVDAKTSDNLLNAVGDVSASVALWKRLSHQYAALHFPSRCDKMSCDGHVSLHRIAGPHVACEPDSDGILG